MNERIKEIRKVLNLTQEAFSSKINLSRNYIAQIESGIKTPSDRTVKDICDEFNINEEWLIDGIGEMFKPVEDKLATYMAQISNGDDDFIKDLIEVYMELDKTSRDALKEITNRMINKKKEREQR